MRLKRLSWMMCVVTLLSCINSAPGYQDCYVTIWTCACDDDLGGPGLGILCGELICVHEVNSCVYGFAAVPSGSSSYGQVSQKYVTDGPAALCDLWLAECVNGVCRISITRYINLHPFTEAWGAWCPSEA